MTKVSSFSGCIPPRYEKPLLLALPFISCSIWFPFHSCSAFVIYNIIYVPPWKQPNDGIFHSCIEWFQVHLWRVIFLFFKLRYLLSLTSTKGKLKNPKTSLALNLRVIKNIGDVNQVLCQFLPCRIKSHLPNSQLFN